MMKRWAVMLGSMSLLGCAAPKPAAPVTTATDGMPEAKVVTLAPPVQSVVEPVIANNLDATPARQQYFQISFYELTVPQGEISRNADFWKPFDETFLTGGVWQHDVLNKNGLRVGRAPIVELQYLKDQLLGAIETPQTLMGTESKDFEMTVRKDVAKQTIFYADRNGVFEGKDFEKCDNLFAVTFHRAPRHEDRVEFRLSPLVRDQRERILMVDRKPEMFTPESFYDLGIRTELGVDECLVIAPSENAIDNKTSVGRIFMMEDRPAERVEKVLVIVPKAKGAVIETTPGQARR